MARSYINAMPTISLYSWQQKNWHEKQLHTTMLIFHELKETTSMMTLLQWGHTSLKLGFFTPWPMFFCYLIFLHYVHIYEKRRYLEPTILFT